MTSSYQNNTNDEESLLLTPINSQQEGSGRKKAAALSEGTKGRILDALIGLVAGVLITTIGHKVFHPSSNAGRFPAPPEQPRPAPSEPATTVAAKQQQESQDDDDDTFRPPRYKQFQNIGFQIYTGGAPGTVLESHNGHLRTLENPECRGHNAYGHLEGEIQCYLGFDNVTHDVQARLQIMEDAVERAYEAADPGSETLKIFVAPEFFFRGIDGAYLMDEGLDQSSTAVSQILQGLEKIVEQERFEDWFFVMGTAIVADDYPVEGEFENLFYNFAPVYKGGRGQLGKRYLVPKRYTSNEDFLTPERHFNETLTKELLQTVPQNEYKEIEHGSNSTVLNPFYELNRTFYDRKMWHDYKDEISARGYTMIEYAWFILDGITMTVEICVDHDVKTALNVFLADSATPRNVTLIPKFDTSPNAVTPVQYVPIPRHQAQISLVSSSGMEITADSLALANGGVIFLQDGANNTAGEMVWEKNECGMFVWHFFGGTEMVTRSVGMSPTEVVFQYQVHGDNIESHDVYPVTRRRRHQSRGDDDDDDTDLRVDWQDAIHGVFSAMKYEPKVKVYPPMDVALVTKDTDNKE